MRGISGSGKSYLAKSLAEGDESKIFSTDDFYGKTKEEYIKNWDVSKIINDTTSGKVFHYEEKDILKHYIFNAFQDYKNGMLHINSTNIEQFSRKHLTQQLSEVILKVTT